MKNKKWAVSTEKKSNILLTFGILFLGSVIFQNLIYADQLTQGLAQTLTNPSQSPAIKQPAAAVPPPPSAASQSAVVPSQASAPAPAAAPPSLAIPTQNSGLGLNPSGTSQSPPTGPARSGSISFEDEIVEGMNKNPFDSLTHLGKKDDRTQSKLYKKKSNFRYEMKYTTREMGLLQ